MHKYNILLNINTNFYCCGKKGSQIRVKFVFLLTVRLQHAMHISSSSVSSFGMKFYIMNQMQTVFVKKKKKRSSSWLSLERSLRQGQFTLLFTSIDRHFQIYTKRQSEGNALLHSTRQYFFFFFFFSEGCQVYTDFAVRDTEHTLFCCVLPNAEIIALFSV